MLNITRLVPWLAFGQGKGRTVVLRALLAAVIVAGGPMREAWALSLIRDTESEHIIRDFSEPVLVASGLNPERVDTFIVNSDQINAFVSGGEKIFIFTGLIDTAETPNELIGVIAHEAGHIKGGHLTRGSDAIGTAQMPAMVGLLLGIGAIAAGAGDAGMAALSLGTHVGQRTFLSFSRAQEASADQSALKALEQSGQSGRGFVTFLDNFADQEAMSERHMDPYAVTHPVSRERMSYVSNLVEESPFRDVEDSPEAQHRFEMMKAKLYAFTTKRPSSVFNKYRESDQSMPARYARAIAYYRVPDIPKALDSIDALIAEQPDNPYFHELKGQALFEFGKVKESIAPYRQANALMPNQPLLMVGLAHSLLSVPGEDHSTEARQILSDAVKVEKDYSEAYRLLAQAYANEGNEPMAKLATAEQLAARGEIQEAKTMAKRAQASLSPGSPAWQRAEDISNMKDPNS